MDMKKLVTASVAAAVALLVVDYLVDMVPFIGGHYPHASFSVWGILGALGHGVVLAVVLGWRGVSDMMDGAKGGATYGVLVSVAHSLQGWEGHAGGGDLIGAAIGSALVVGIAGAVVAMATGGSDD